MLAGDNVGHRRSARSHITARQSEQFTSLAFEVHTSPVRFPHAARVPE
jgi:hypothetical protein